jgi:hypothetical protein
MPPKNQKLPDQQIADLEAWVKMGAPDPRDDKAAVATNRKQRNNIGLSTRPSANRPECEKRRYG